MSIAEKGDNAEGRPFKKVLPLVLRTKTLDALCYALDCEVSDIIKFEKE